MHLGIGSEGDDNEGLGGIAEINIIPLVDIMLVLLITFMIAAPLSIRGINVNLPVSRAKGQNIDGPRVILTIDTKGSFYLDKVEISSVNLSERFSAIFATKKDKALFIRADKSVPYGRVVDAMSAAKLAGVEKIGMLTTAPTNPTEPNSSSQRGSF